MCVVLGKVVSHEEIYFGSMMVWALRVPTQAGSGRGQGAPSAAPWAGRVAPGAHSTHTPALPASFCEVLVATQHCSSLCPMLRGSMIFFMLKQNLITKYSNSSV